MVSRRALLRAVAVSGTIGIAGCNTFIGNGSDDDSPQNQTETTVLTPTSTTVTETATPTESPTTTSSDTDTPTATTTHTPTPTVAEQIGTSVYESESGVDEFGKAVDLSTETAIVVAEEHGGYVFDAGNGGWTNTAVLTPADREDFGGLDPSTALVNDRAIIGGPEAGAVYLFERTDDGWTQRNRFAPEKTEAGEFGRSVAFDGDRLVVGDANEPTTMVSYVGGAYVFAHDEGDWSQEASFTTGNQDLFGTAVAIDGETLLVGAPFADPDENSTGAVYVYERVDGAWERQTMLSPADPADVVYQGRFGQAVALDGDTAVVGAPEIPRGSGRAYVFQRTETGWTQNARVSAPDIEDGAEFGTSVAINDETVVVGAQQAHETGRAYVFRANDTWTDPLRLTAADPHEDVEFGAAVALLDGAALVGAPVYEAASGAYLFDL